jgi:hypothetical protein
MDLSHSSSTNSKYLYTTGRPECVGIIEVKFDLLENGEEVA